MIKVHRASWRPYLVSVRLCFRVQRSHTVAERLWRLSPQKIVSILSNVLCTLSFALPFSLSKIARRAANSDHVQPESQFQHFAKFDCADGVLIHWYGLSLLKSISWREAREVAAFGRLLSPHSFSQKSCTPTFPSRCAAAFVSCDSGRNPAKSYPAKVELVRIRKLPVS
jgi:hypothetical protein